MSEAGRVIAGSARGLRLRAPGEGTRPIGDRVKETLFAILEPDLPGARVLDLFAGSGACGIEALSRRAAAAVFVERDARAATVIGENLRRARLAGSGSVVRTDVARYLRDRAAADGPFDVVIVDPPYAEAELMDGTLTALGGSHGLLAPGAWVVAKHFWRTPPGEAPALLASVRTRRFGETGLTFYRLVDRAGDAATGEAGKPESQTQGEQEAAR
jgi:16S rRNA (guanine966-N2)-methyltransferase